MSVTAKIRCSTKSPTTDGGASLSFQADYAHGRNKAWAQATPSLSISMTVNPEAAKHFESGQAYVLTFDAEPEPSPGVKSYEGIAEFEKDVNGGH